MFSATALVLLMSVLNLAFSEKYVYVVKNVPSVPCIESSAKDICPVDHNVPKLRIFLDSIGSSIRAQDIGNATTIEAHLNATLETWTNYNATENCTAAVKNFLCERFLPACRDSDDFFEINDRNTIDACYKGFQECAGLPGVSEVFNCSALTTERHRRREICKDFPDIKDDPYPCLKRGYKVPEYATKASHLLDLLKAHKLLKSEESKIDKNCRDSVADTICKIGFPACTKDRKHIVSLLSTQRCHTISKCFSDSGIHPALALGALRLCNKLPDETAMKINTSVALGILFQTTSPAPESETTSQATGRDQASKTLTFAFLLLLSLLF